MATQLFGWTWVGDEEPTTGVLATQEWINPTTGEKFQRDTSNASWIVMGNVNSRLGGAVEVAGSTVTGPILDVPNLLPVNDPDAVGTIRQGGFPVALMTSLAALEKRIYDRIIYQVREQYLSQLRRSVIGSSMAIGYPIINDGQTIPLPFYDDGVQATKDQVVLVFASINTIPDGYDLHTNEPHCSVDSNLVVSVWARQNDNAHTPGTANCIIMCLR